MGPPRGGYLLLELPSPLLALVISFVCRKLTRYDREGRDLESGAIFEDVLDIKAVMRFLPYLCKSGRQLSHETKELFLCRKGNYFGSNFSWRGRARRHVALVIGCSSGLTNTSLSALVGRFTHLQGAPSLSPPLATVLIDLDLRSSPSITAASVVVVFRTCSALERLDMGECKGLNLVELAARLRSYDPAFQPQHGLVVKKLGLMEVCGSGQGSTWVGYRQQLAFLETHYTEHVSRSYSVCNYSTYPHIGGARWYRTVTIELGGPSKEVKSSDAFHKVGSSPFLRPAVRAIESIVRSLQEPRPVFTLAVNVCEHCRTSFAEFMPHDGEERGAHFDTETMLRYLREYGQHVCLQCGHSAFLCLECASYEFHYCADVDCKACYCVSCDGGRSISGIYQSDNDAALADLRREGTKHFQFVSCKWGDKCRWSKDWRILCRDLDGKCTPMRDICRRCDRWQCYRCCMDDGPSCESCGYNVCPDCRAVEFCTDCDVPLCSRCDKLPACEECSPTVGADGTEYPHRHCRDCRKEAHPPLNGEKKVEEDGNDEGDEDGDDDGDDEHEDEEDGADEGDEDGDDEGEHEDEENEEQDESNGMSV